MKRFIFIIIILSTLMFSCSMGPVPAYYDRPVVRLCEYSGTLAFYIPDIDNRGWDDISGSEGADTVSVALSAYLDSGDEAYLKSITYRLYADNNSVMSVSDEYIIPLCIEDADTVALKTLNIIIEERDAYDLDIADGTQDESGSGLIEFTLTFEDNKGDAYSTVPIRIAVTVAQP